MGNKHGKEVSDDGHDDHPPQQHKRDKKEKKGKDERLYDLNATGAEVYPQALKEKDPETKAELFRHAALCYKEEKDWESAAMAFRKSGEIFAEIDIITDAVQAYEDAFMTYGLLGGTKFDDFKDCADEAILLAGRSKYDSISKGCKDRIQQAILRMIDSVENEKGLAQLIRSGLFQRYMKGDHFINGSRTLLKKLKSYKVQDMYLWALMFKTTVDHYVGLFILDNSIDEELNTFACAAVLTAYLFSLQPTEKKKKKKNASNQSTDSLENIGNQPVPNRRASASHQNNEFYQQPPNYEEYVAEFKTSVPIFKRIGNQLTHNIITACQAGDLDSIDENFHELYFTRHVNKWGLIEFLSEVFAERFKVYIEKGFIQPSKWDEQEHILPTEAAAEDGKGKGAHNLDDYL